MPCSVLVKETVVLQLIIYIINKCLVRALLIICHNRISRVYSNIVEQRNFSRRSTRFEPGCEQYRIMYDICAGKMPYIVRTGTYCQ